MGLWDTLTNHAKAQFLDVIEFLDNSNDTLVWRFPVFNQAITDNSKVVVREGQAAVFIAEGKLSDVFAPGTYTVNTPNSPMTGFFQSIAYGLNYPYKGDILFVSTRQFTDNGWGTPNPIMMRDAEFGPIRVRAFGIFAFRVTDPAVFIKNVVGTDGLFTTDEIRNQLKQKLIAGLASAIGELKIPVLDLAQHYMDLGDKIRDRLNGGFQSTYGITITDLSISNISLPPEVEKALDARTKMGVLGNLDAYAKLQAAEAIPEAARNTGLGGAGVGLGVGMGMGGMMGQAFAGAAGQGGTFNPVTGQMGAAPPPPPGASLYHYNGPGGQAQLPLAQVVERVAANRGAAHHLWQPGWAAWKGWQEVAEVASALPPVPPPAPAGPPPIPGANVSFHVHGAGLSGEKTAAEIAAIVRGGVAVSVWKTGFDGWKPAADVPEIAAAMNAGGPPPPPSAPPPPPI